MSPKVSVIIPVYKVEDYLDECLESVVKQTYKNIELIIIDDCSTDSTYTKIQTLALKDKRIKLYKNDKNKKWSQVGRTSIGNRGTGADR